MRRGCSRGGESNPKGYLHLTVSKSIDTDETRQSGRLRQEMPRLCIISLNVGGTAAVGDGSKSPLHVTLLPSGELKPANTGMWSHSCSHLNLICVASLSAAATVNIARSRSHRIGWLRVNVFVGQLGQSGLQNQDSSRLPGRMTNLETANGK